MEVNAVPASTSPATAVGGVPAAAVHAVGDAFAGLFAAAMHDAGNGAPEEVPVNVGDPKIIVLPKGTGQLGTSIVGPPPQPPPESPEVVNPIVSEKEAPTPAPNTPVDPLDPSSEDSKKDLAKTEGVPASIPATVAPPLAVPVSSPVVLVSAASKTSAVAPPASPMPVRSPSVTVSAPAASQERDDRSGTVDVAPTASASSASAQTAPAQRLNAAPDLGVVPQVVPNAAPVVSAAATSPVVAPNVRVVPIAERAAPPVEAPVAKPIATAKAEASNLAFVDATVALGDADKDGDASAGDEAPKDPTPQAPAPTVAKSIATERPDAGADRPAVDRHLVVRQVADRIESLVAARPKDGVTIHLEPRDLGTVTLVVKGLSSALDVQVTASDERVRQGLDASRSDLAQALAPRGIGIRELRVSTAPTPPTGTAESGSNSNGGSGANPEGRARPQNPSPVFAKAASPRSSTPRPSRTSGRGVDLLV